MEATLEPESKTRLSVPVARASSQLPIKSSSSTSQGLWVCGTLATPGLAWGQGQRHRQPDCSLEWAPRVGLWGSAPTWTMGFRPGFPMFSELISHSAHTCLFCSFLSPENTQAPPYLMACAWTEQSLQHSFIHNLSPRLVQFASPHPDPTSHNCISSTLYNSQVN